MGLLLEGGQLPTHGGTMTTLTDAEGTFALIRDVRYSLVAVFCLLVYEWFANLEDEVKLIHRSRWSSVRVAYMLCRYYPLLYWVVVLWAYCLNHHPSVCIRVLKPIHAFLAPFQFFAQAVLFMRAYAFSGRNKVVLCILTIAYSLVVAADAYLFLVDIPFPAVQKFSFLLQFGGTGCFPDYSTKAMGRRIGFAIIASSILDVSSLIIVMVYCVKWNTGRTPLSLFFLRQGLSAFAWVGTINIVSMIFYFRAHNSASGIGLPFSLVISNVLACRLILSLRSHARITDTQMDRDHSRIVDAAFQFNSMQGPSSVDVWVVRSPSIASSTLSAQHIELNPV